MDGAAQKCYNQVAMKLTERETVADNAQNDGARPDAPMQAGLTAAEVLEALEKEYSPFLFAQEPRYDPISEVVFTILSQHTSDVNSERAFRQLMDTFGSFEKVSEGDLDLIAQSINVGGLAKIKAPRIKRVLNLITEKRGSLDLSFLKDLPLDEAKAWLRELPGVGPKTAAIILCFALGMPAMAVDTHIYRVSKRLGLIGPKTSYEQSHDILERSVEPDQVFTFHMALITHGRKVCKAPRPLCDRCILAYGCPSRELGNTRKLPKE